MIKTDNGLILNSIKAHLGFDTDADLANFLGISRQNLSAWRSRNSINVNIIVDKMPELNRAWLLTGEGEMLASENSKAEDMNQPHEFSLDQIEKAQELADQLGVELIPMFSEPFRGGNEGYNFIESWNEVESFWTLPNITADMIITVIGNSMAPIFPQGSHLAISRFSFRPDEPYSIPFGEVFAIALRDPDDTDATAVTSYVKRLYKHPDHARSKTHWIARSDNEKYDDFEIAISHVASLWRVRASVTYFA